MRAAILADLLLPGADALDLCRSLFADGEHYCRNLVVRLDGDAAMDLMRDYVSAIYTMVFAALQTVNVRNKHKFAVL